MDVKTFKSDLTYAIKKLTKEGKTFTCELLPDNLTIVDGQFVLADKFDALEAFVFVKGLEYIPEKFVDNWEDKDGVKHHSEWLYHEAYGVPVTDIVSLKSEITKTDLYSFMDGVENVEVSNPKDPWYLCGVYMREKFTPVGARTEPLRRVEYTTPRTGQLVKKWIVYTRPMPGCKRGGPPTILEVECELLSAVESPAMLPKGEYMARVLKPEFLYEEVRVLKDGVLKDVIMPPVYCSHSLYWTVHQARAAANAMVRGEIEFTIRKQLTTSIGLEAYTAQELQAKYDEIKEVPLDGTPTTC
jgi:hypothetical protein